MLILALISIAVLSGGALAHPPADVVVTYSEKTGDLAVTITHQVDDPATHYVKPVVVKQGDLVLIDTSYTSQPDRTSFTYHYNLPQLKGSTGEIQMEAQCSQSGSRSGILMLTRTRIPEPPGSPESPLCACTALVVIGFLVTRFLR